MGVAMAERDSARTFAGELVGLRFGNTEILDVQDSITTDEAGDDALYLALVLSDPAEDTWPADEILELRKRVITLAIERGLETALYVRLSPKTDDDSQDDEVESHQQELFGDDTPL